MLDKKGVAKEEKQIYEQIEGKLSTLARLSRATGINLFMGVQRPDANVLTGQIKIIYRSEYQGVLRIKPPVRLSWEIQMR